MLDLNTITKEDFVTELIMSDDVADFYYPREKQLLSMDFDFDAMKAEFEAWLEENSDFKL